MTSRLTPGPTGYFGRAIADANDTHGRYAADLDAIPLIGRTVVPQGWLPWLLRNEGLEPLMPYVDWSTLWDEGRAWLRIRGTAHASVQALGWIGWSVQFEYGPAGTDHYDRYQIHLDRVPWRHELERLIPLEKLAKSEDSIFFRLVHGYDIRAVRGGMSRYGGAIFARSSGVDVRKDWPRLSFRETLVMHWPASTRVHASETFTIADFTTRRGDITYGNSRYCSRAKSGPVFAMDLSDSAAVVGPLAKHRAVDRIEPIAGVVSGRTRYGSRQAVPYPIRLVAGEIPRMGSYRFGRRLRPAATERVYRIPEPVSLAAFASAGATTEFHDAYADHAHVVVNPAVTAIDAPDGPAEVAIYTNLDDAPWSGLPWSDEPFGTSPRIHATEETT